MKRAPKENTPDELEEYITSIFGSIDTDCDVNSGINDSSDDVNDGKTVQVIHDDYTYNLREALDTNDNNNNRDTSGATVTALGCGDIFVLGNEKMIELKIPAVRERKQDRMLRSQAFF